MKDDYTNLVSEVNALRDHILELRKQEELAMQPFCEYLARRIIDGMDLYADVKYDSMGREFHITCFGIINDEIIRLEVQNDVYDIMDEFKELSCGYSVSVYTMDETKMYFGATYRLMESRGMTKR